MKSSNFFKIVSDGSGVYLRKFWLWRDDIDKLGIKDISDSFFGLDKVRLEFDWEYWTWDFKASVLGKRHFDDTFFHDVLSRKWWTLDLKESLLNEKYFDDIVVQNVRWTLDFNEISLNEKYYNDVSFHNILVYSNIDFFESIGFFGVSIFLLVCGVLLLSLIVILSRKSSLKFIFRVVGIVYFLILGLAFILSFISRSISPVLIGSSFCFFEYIWWFSIIMIFFLWLYGLILFFWCLERSLFDAEIFCILVFYGGLLLIFNVSCDFLLFFLTLEGLTYLTYSLLGIGSFRRYGLEVITKYFVLSAITSGLVLFGITMLYYIYGTIGFFELSILIEKDSNLYYFGLVGFSCILVGLLFKLGIFPFHFWISDVYFGCSSVVLLFLSTLSKLVIIVAFLKFVYFFSNFLGTLKILLMILGIITFFVGSIGGLLETNVYRVLGYSGMGNIGFLFVCYSLLNILGLITFVIYSIIYFGLIYLLFLLFCLLGYRYHSSLIELRDVNWTILVYKYSWILGFGWTIILFSLVGLPPLIGFFSKYMWLFTGKYGLEFLVLVTLLVMVSVGVVYYVRFIRYSVVEGTLESVRIVLVNNLVRYRVIFVYLLIINLILIIFSWWFGYWLILELEMVFIRDFLFYKLGG